MKRLALLLLPIAALAGLLAWLLRPTPQAPLAPGEAPAPVEPELAPVAETAQPAAPVEPPDEPLPDEPTVAQKVATSPAEPLLWFRGPAPDQPGGLLWSHPKQRRKTIPIRDGQVGLRGNDKPDAVQRGPLQVAATAAAGPMLVSVGAKWCKPCMAELGDLLELAEQITLPASGDVKAARPRLALVLQDEASEWTMAEVRDRFFSDYNSKHRKGRSALKPPAWMEVRADLESQWGRALELGKVLGSGPVTLPVNMLLDGCGHVQAIASGSLDAEKRKLFADAAARLKGTSCAAMPLPAPSPVRARPAAPARPADSAAKPAGTAAPGAGTDVAAPLKADPEAATPSDPLAAGKSDPATAAKPADKPDAASEPSAKKPESAAPLPAATTPTGASKPSSRPPASGKKP